MAPVYRASICKAIVQIENALWQKHLINALSQGLVAINIIWKIMFDVLFDILEFSSKYYLML